MSKRTKERYSGSHLDIGDLERVEVKTRNEDRAL